jgi:hypothetical protein
LQAIFGARPRLEREASLPVGLAASYQTFPAPISPNSSPQGSVSAATSGTGSQDGDVAPNWGTYMKTMRFVHLMKKHTRTPSNSDPPSDEPKLSETMPATRPSFLRAQSMSSMLVTNNFTRTQPLPTITSGFPPFSRAPSIPISVPPSSFTSTTNSLSLNNSSSLQPPVTPTPNLENQEHSQTATNLGRDQKSFIQPNKSAHELKKEAILQKQNGIRKKMLDKMKAKTENDPKWSS